MTAPAALFAAPATVPFGLLAAVELMTAAAYLTLGIACSWPRLRSRATALLAAAVALLAVPEVLSGIRFGNANGTILMGARGIGALLLAFAIQQGALDPLIERYVDRLRPSAGPAARSTSSVGGGSVGGAAVVAPLGALPSVAWLTAAAFAVAALVGRRQPRSVRLPLVAGLLLQAAAAVLAPAARTSSTLATELLLARGLGALCLLAVLVVVARASVLGRVAMVVCAAVILTATGAVAVAGSLATNTLEREQADTARRLLRQAEAELDTVVRRDEIAARQTANCPGGPGECARLVPRSGFAAVVADGRAGWIAGTRDPNALGVLPSYLVTGDTASGDVVRSGETASGLAVIPGNPARLVAIGLSPSSTDGSRLAVVTPIDLHDLPSARAADLAALLRPGQGLLSTTFPPDLQVRLDALLEDANAKVTRRTAAEPAVLIGLRGRGRVAAAPVAGMTAVPGQPSDPRVGVLAAAPRDDELVRAQRRVLSGLFLGLAGLAIAVGLVGVWLGVGVVRPVRRVTAAARRVRAGDTTASAGPGGPDELGELARAFDEMTTSLTGTQEELRRTANREATLRARLSTVVDSIGDGLVVVDDTQIITSSNPAARTLLGLDPQGLPLREVLPTGNEVVLADPGREPVHLSVWSAPLAGGGGSVVMLRDRTRERQAERMKTQFLANVSHELRTPLTPVRGYADLLRRRSDAGPSEVAAHASAIASAADRMGRVVDLLVDVAALDAGRVTPTSRALQLEMFVAERAGFWRGRRPDRADDLRIEVPDGLPPVWTDPRWLAKALDELLDNAFKYSAPGTPVTIEASLGEHRVCLAVRDAGPGLGEADRSALYDDFVQADGSVTRAQDGLGLGLPFVRRVADLVDLHLVVDSEPGEGACFGLQVPLAPGSGTRGHAGAGAGAGACRCWCWWAPGVGAGPRAAGHEGRLPGNLLELIHVLPAVARPRPARHPARRGSSITVTCSRMARRTAGRPGFR